MDITQIYLIGTVEVNGVTKKVVVNLWDAIEDGRVMISMPPEEARNPDRLRRLWIDDACASPELEPVMELGQFVPIRG